MSTKKRCSLCSRQFDSKDSYRQHLDAAHKVKDGIYLKKCTIGTCQKTFPSFEHLQEHIRKNNHGQTTNATAKVPDTTQTTLMCKECGQKNFKTGLDLQNHKQMSHAVSMLSRRDTITIEKEFKTMWRHESTIVTTVDSVWRVRTDHLKKDYEQYRELILQKLKSVKNINEVNTYHGTTLSCNLGVKGNTNVCNRHDCNLCNIIKSGFKTKKAKVNDFMGFGKGVYSTPISSKAHGYNSGSELGLGKGRRAVLACKVLLGRPFFTETYIPNLGQPPEGFDSVWAKPGKDLKFEEIVVYNPKAMMLNYIIVYTYK